MTAMGTDKPTLLLVEDDDQEAFLFEKMLREESGAAVIDRAVEGQQTLELVRANPDYDCIVLDLKLAGEDGVWVLEQLSQSPEISHIPVIVFSGDTERLQQACSQYANVVSSVRKPETLEQYRSALTIVMAILHAALDVA
jgi:CheY-like chemotaxis protein